MSVSGRRTREEQVGGEKRLEEGDAVRGGRPGASRDARVPNSADVPADVKILKERALAIELSTYKQFKYSTSNDYRASERGCDFSDSSMLA